MFVLYEQWRGISHWWTFLIRSPTLLRMHLLPLVHLLSVMFKLDPSPLFGMAVCSGVSNLNSCIEGILERILFEQLSYSFLSCFSPPLNINCFNKQWDSLFCKRSSICDWVCFEYRQCCAGDANSIRVGSETNIQDHSLVTVGGSRFSGGSAPTVIGNKVTIGACVWFW
jgi:hypothetical protein